MSGRSAPPADGDDGFLARWSRRKAQGRDGRAADRGPEPAPVALPPAAAGAAVAAPPVSAPAVAPATTQGAAAGAAPAREQTPHAQPGDAAAARERAPPPQLTLADVERLTQDSDFSAFAARDVEPRVRNAALKKLFHSLPQFNVMDGLDVYIDDYSKGEPLPRAAMRQMLQARALGLLDDELKEQDKPAPDATVAAAPAAEATADEAGPGEAPVADSRRTDEDVDLQLQPDDAAGHEAARAGAGDTDASRRDSGRDGVDDGAAPGRNA